MSSTRQKIISMLFLALAVICLVASPAISSPKHNHSNNKKDNHSIKKDSKHEGHNNHKSHDMHNKSSEHDHSDTIFQVSKNKLLSVKDIDVFTKVFNLIEKELNKINKTQFNSVDSFGVPLKKSIEVEKILKAEKISGVNYIEIFDSITSAYNEVKMVRFEENIRKNRHEKFVYREGLMIDHKNKDHSVLHDSQADNFSQAFDAEGLGSSATEPKENIKLVEKYEVALDSIFKN